MSMKCQNVSKWLKSIGSFLSPIIYLLFWYFFLVFVSRNIPTLSFNSDTVLILSFVVFILGLITKSPSWSIGHDKFGVKSDSRSRLINFHKSESGDYWFDLFADNPEVLNKEEIRKLIEELTSGRVKK